MLTFTVNGREPGATLQLDSKRDRSLEVHAAAESQLPYDRLEIVVERSVVAAGDAQRAPAPRGDPRWSTRSAGVAGWPRALWKTSSATATRGVDFQQVHVDAGLVLSDYYGTRRPETVFAHSSPVYVIRDGAPIRSWDDAEYYVRYLDNASTGWKRKASLRVPRTSGHRSRLSSRAGPFTPPGRKRLSLVSEKG